MLPIGFRVQPAAGTAVSTEAGLTTERVILYWAAARAQGSTSPAVSLVVKSGRVTWNRPGPVVPGHGTPAQEGPWAGVPGLARGYRAVPADRRQPPRVVLGAWVRPRRRRRDSLRTLKPMSTSTPRMRITIMMEMTPTMSVWS